MSIIIEGICAGIILLALSIFIRQIVRALRGKWCAECDFCSRCKKK